MSVCAQRAFARLRHLAHILFCSACHLGLPARLNAHNGRRSPTFGLLVAVDVGDSREQLVVEAEHDEVAAPHADEVRDPGQHRGAVPAPTPRRCGAASPPVSLFEFGGWVV